LETVEETETDGKKDSLEGREVREDQANNGGSNVKQLGGLRATSSERLYQPFTVAGELLLRRKETRIGGGGGT